MEDKRIEVTLHGIYWIMGTDSMPECPECQNTNHAIEITKDLTAKCICHACGCEFTVTKTS